MVRTSIIPIYILLQRLACWRCEENSAWPRPTSVLKAKGVTLAPLFSESATTGPARAAPSFTNCNHYSIKTFIKKQTSLRATNLKRKQREEGHGMNETNLCEKIVCQCRRSASVNSFGNRKILFAELWCCPKQLHHAVHVAGVSQVLQPHVPAI